MDFISNLDLLGVGLALILTGVLGFVVFIHNTKSITHKSFLFFCLMTIAWGTCNFLSNKIGNPEIAFILLRVSIFFAVWHTFSFFQLLYVFPKEDFKFNLIYFYGLLPVVIGTSLFTLTPLVFEKIAELTVDGKIDKVVNGPGIALFSMVILMFIVSGLAVFIKNIIKSDRLNRRSLWHMLVGMATTISLIVIFNFIFPAFLSNADYVSLGTLFVFPFILFTTYSILRHNLLDVKVISTEILTSSLGLILLFEVISSSDLPTLLLRVSILILVLCISVLLVRSVVREVEQRKVLQKLTNDLQDANEQLKSLDKARAEFISIASHQLRTPPATIKWYLAAILSGDYGNLDAGVKETIEKAQVTNNGLISLIDDLLNASRIERGKMEFLFEPTDISPIIKLAVDQLIPQAKIKKLVLSYEQPVKPLSPIMADKEKLRQVFNNMIDNAIKYTPSGSVAVNVFEKDDQVFVTVKDTGKGISKDQIASVFDKYNRGKDSAMHATGLGLGMYVAKVVIDQHKGKIWAESEGEDQGSTFIVSIPVHSGVAQSTEFDLTK